MVIISGHSMNEIYANTCEELRRAPVVNARGLITKEITGAHLALFNPLDSIVTLKSRHMDMRYCLGEMCYFLAGRTDLASIYEYSKFWAKVSDDGKTVNSAYGHRLFYVKNIHNRKQLGYVVCTLLEDPSSRKAVMPIYDKDDAHWSKDNPCTMFMQFLIRDNKLDCYVSMRSNDVWYGLPYDVAFFTLVQQIVLTELKYAMPNLELGFYYHDATSLHAYVKDWEGIEKCNCAHCGSTLESIVPQLTHVDTDNWFNNLLTYEKSLRGCVHYKNAGPETPFQKWGKFHLTNSIKA